MEGAQYEAQVLRKSRVTTRYSSVGENGHTYTLTKHTSRASYRTDGGGGGGDSPQKVGGGSGVDEDEETKLRSRGIELVESNTPRYEKVSPEQVADYYKSLGDWQNVLPKTDYSYSPVSRFYKKKINGVIPVIPNMSRRDIRCTPEEVDNEVNLYSAQNYVYEETRGGAHGAYRSSSRNRYKGGSGNGSGYSNNVDAAAFNADDALYSSPYARTSSSSSSTCATLNGSHSTHSSAKLSRLRYAADKKFQGDYYSSSFSAYSLISMFVNSVCGSAQSLVSASYGFSRSLLSAFFGAIYFAVTSTVDAAHSVSSRTSGAAYSYARHTYSSIVRRAQSPPPASALYPSLTKTTSSSLGGGGGGAATFWKLFAVVALILLLCVSFRGFVSVSGDTNASTLTAPVSKSYSFLTNLVCGVYELTVSSVAFISSAMSVAGRRALDGLCAVQLATLSQLTRYAAAPSLWLFSSSGSDGDEDKTETTSGASGIAGAVPSTTSGAEIERLFKRWLETTGSDELARKIMASGEFARFIDEKLERVQQAGEERMEELVRGQRPLALERRVAELEERLLRLETTEDARQELERNMKELRAEMERRERDLEKEVIVVLAAVLGASGSADEGDSQASGTDELKSRFRTFFVAVEAMQRRVERVEKQFAKFAKNSTESADAQFERTARDMRHELRVSVEEMVAKKLAEWKASSSSATTTPGAVVAGPQADQLEAYVKGVVREALAVYDADKTAQADYALESSGGVVLSTRCTETKTTNAQFSVFGIPLWHVSRSPRTVIQPGVHPGECWAFSGSTGYLVVQLSERIFVTGVTVEHIPRALAPNGTIDSAPKDFSVWALVSESDPEPQSLGTFRFEVDGPSLQYFETTRLAAPYRIVELKILSNHGKLDYTCLYRLRVHGIPA